MKRILLEKVKEWEGEPEEIFAEVDDEDFEKVRHDKWFVLIINGKGKKYVFRETPIESGVPMKIAMAKDIVDIPTKKVYFHLDRNYLNNKRSNLVVVSEAERYLMLPGWGKSSKFKGVSRHKRGKKWQVQICGKHLGYFDDEESAARAYDAHVKRNHSKLAFLNFPKKQETGDSCVPASQETPNG